MKKELLNNAFYHVVTLIDKEDKEYKGWFVPEQRGSGYTILPNDDIWTIYTFSASYIKDVIFATNGFSLKKLSKELNKG